MQAIVDSDTIQESYVANGFGQIQALYGADDIAKVNRAVDAVIRGEYDLDRAPSTAHDPSHLTQSLVKINDAHLASHDIYSFLTDPRFGDAVGRVTGAKRVQIWATQLLVKRPSSDTQGGVGWHRDETYWKYWTGDSELFTAWIALSDVTFDSGPVCMVPGSHGWQDDCGGNFFDGDLDSVKRTYASKSGEPWVEEPMILAPGAISFHHKRTVHGSYANTSTAERRSIAVHMCTENAWPDKDAQYQFYTQNLDDPMHAPVIFGT